ncbi:MAG: hypothetical protein VB957_02680 [Pseudomonadales bacterium]
MSRLRNFIQLAASLALLVGALSGCSSGESKVEAAMLKTGNQLQVLNSALDGGTIRNATIIKQYSSILKSSRPELKPLLFELEKDATTMSPVYTSLQQRYSAVKDNIEQFDSWTAKVQELNAIQTASTVAIYNDALSDTVNVIADLSHGELARVNAVSQEAEQKANGSKNFGAGSQYIGNPHYGHWSQRSGGSFWAWYGQYHFFSSMFGGRRYYYNDWGRNRGYSYYNDVGRSSFTSRSQRASQGAVDNRARKQFGSKGTYKSPYSKSRVGASGISRASTAQQKSLFKSQYSGSSKRSKFQSSSRNSGFRTSRGVSRGK